jgi:hypothetical protein
MYVRTINPVCTLLLRASEQRPSCLGGQLVVLAVAWQQVRIPDYYAAVLVPEFPGQHLN